MNNFISYINRGVIPNCRRILPHYTYLFPETHRSRSSLAQMNGNNHILNHGKLNFDCLFNWYLCEYRRI